MHICLVTGSYPPLRDGVGEYTQALAQSLANHEPHSLITVITSTAPAGIPDHPATPPPRLSVRREAGTWTIKDVRAVSTAISTDIQPDVVHIQYPTRGYGRKLGPSLLPWHIRRRSQNIPLLATLHEYSNRTMKGKARLISSILGCHGIIAVDQDYLHRLGRLLDFRRIPRWTVPVGSLIQPTSDPSDGARFRARYNIPPDHTVLAYFGVLREGKGIPLLFQTIEQLAHRPKSVLLLVGRSDQDRYIATRIKQLPQPLVNRIIVTGELDPSLASAALQASDIGLFPFEDGVSGKRTSFAAALHHGLPCVTFVGNRPPQGLAHGLNAIFVNKGDIGQFILEVARLMDDLDGRSRISNAALDFARTQLSWETIAGRHTEIYTALTSHT